MSIPRNVFISDESNINSLPSFYRVNKLVCSVIYFISSSSNIILNNCNGDFWNQVSSTCKESFQFVSEGSSNCFLRHMTYLLLVLLELAGNNCARGRILSSSSGILEISMSVDFSKDFIWSGLLVSLSFNQSHGACVLSSSSSLNHSSEQSPSGHNIRNTASSGVSIFFRESLALYSSSSLESFCLPMFSLSAII